MGDTDKKTTEQNQSQDTIQVVKPDMSDWDNPIKRDTMTYSEIEKAIKGDGEKINKLIKNKK